MSDKTFGKFRKKAVTVEAYKFNNLAGSRGERPRWLIDAVEAGEVWFQGGDHPYLTISTAIGSQRANLGDWVVRREGTGDLFVCEPDVFEAMFETSQGEQSHD